jgi:uncharacterized protein YceK
MKFTLTILVLIVLAGCASVQESYKPLYQAIPEKQAIQKK